MKLLVVCIQMSHNNKRLVLSTTREEVRWDRELKWKINCSLHLHYYLCAHTITKAVQHNCTVSKWTLETCSTGQKTCVPRVPDFQGTLSDRREVNEFRARGVISTHISLGEKAVFIRINESYMRRAVRYTPALLKIQPSFLNRLPSSRPRDPSPSVKPKTSIHNQSCPGIPGAPLGEGGTQNLPTMGILISVGNSPNGASIHTVQRNP